MRTLLLLAVPFLLAEATFFQNMPRSFPTLAKATDNKVPTEKEIPIIDERAFPDVVPATDNLTTTTVSPSHSRFEEDLEELKKEFDIFQGEIRMWMDRPYTRSVVLPILLGMASAIVTLLSIWVVIRMCKKFRMRRRSSVIVKSPKELPRAVAIKLSDDEM